MSFRTRAKKMIDRYKNYPDIKPDMKVISDIVEEYEIEVVRLERVIRELRQPKSPKKNIDNPFSDIDGMDWFSDLIKRGGN